MMSAGVDIAKVRLLASIALILTWGQLFFWFRLFDRLAYYVDLIIQTIREIKHFMAVLSSLILMFQSGFYMLNLNRLSLRNQDENTGLYSFDENQDTLYGAGVISQYIMLLGDWGDMNLKRSYEGYGDGAIWVQLENALSILFFIMATFCT